MTDQLTLQQITDRLAEEAGWMWINTDKFAASEGFWCNGKDAKKAHPFPPDDLNAAVRAVGDVCDVRISRCNGEWQVVIYQVMSPMNDDIMVAHSHPAHALYFACAKARGWM